MGYVLSNAKCKRWHKCSNESEHARNAADDDECAEWADYEYAARFNERTDEYARRRNRSTASTQCAAHRRTASTECDATRRNSAAETHCGVSFFCGNLKSRK